MLPGLCALTRTGPVLGGWRGGLGLTPIVAGPLAETCFLQTLALMGLMCPPFT